MKLTLAMLVTFLVHLAGLALLAPAAEWARLTPENWEQLVPEGKEVDAIYGDFVLRNNQIVVVIGNPVPGRNANLTINNVGGSIIDLTRRDLPSDQLGALIPGLGRWAFGPPTLTPDATANGNGNAASQQAAMVALECTAPAGEGSPGVTVRYELGDDQPFVTMTTVLSNPHDTALEVELLDTLRADGRFEKGVDPALKLAWVYDEWWKQAYGIVADGIQLQPESADAKSRSSLVRYQAGEGTRITLEPGKAFSIKRRVFPGANLLDVKAIASRLAEMPLAAVMVNVKDPAGPLANATVRYLRQDQLYAWGRTLPQGTLQCELPPGSYQAKISALGRPDKTLAIDTSTGKQFDVELEAPGYVVGVVTDADGNPIPCKVEFRLQDKEAPLPYFGPDTLEFAVSNLVYSPDGKFRQEIGPGDYEAIVSHGPEYDAAFVQLKVERGKEASLDVRLAHSVDTRGWVSADFHSHSSPSGDNTSSQLGRVLNLLAEHIEFAPCTEHARVSSYEPHLVHLKAQSRMATCSGIELTGLPLPLNHHNSFPLVMKPRTQNGGGPYVDPDPVVQIARLAMWDNGAEKLVQQNHPNLVQLLTDRDQDGQADGGFEPAFGYMDVIEVHPPGLIFAPYAEPTQPRSPRNTIFNWLQLLNLGYRIPGVVNTDAHYNFHGSGWLRNYLASSTDDPGKIQISEMVQNSQRGRLVMSNGPFLEVALRHDLDGKTVETPVGDEVRVPGGVARLHVRVQCPNWFDINRVQVFVNGRADEKLNLTRKNASDRFTANTVRFDQEIPLNLKSDAHLIVAVAGEGLQLGPVMGPDHGKDMPVAVSNPIFVDVDGNGFQPNRELLGVSIPIAADHQPSRPNGRHPHVRAAR